MASAVIIRKDLKEIGASWEEVKSDTLNRLRWRKIGLAVNLRWFGPVVGCY